MRSLVRTLRLVEKGPSPAPAALVRRHGQKVLSAPAGNGRFVGRSMTNSAAPPAAPCSGCEWELHELRREMVAENQRIWRMYEDMLAVNHKLLQKLCDVEAESAKRHVDTVESMVNISYYILSTGAVFMGSVFVGMSPLLKAAWQEDTIEVMEQRLEGTALNGEEVEKEALSGKAQVVESTGSSQVAAASQGAARNGQKGEEDARSGNAQVVEGTGSSQVAAGAGNK